MISRSILRGKNWAPLSITRVARRNFTVDVQTVVTTMTESFQAFHEFSGIPWWALIPISTITLRSLWTLPLSILQRKRLQKQAEYRPLIEGTKPILRSTLGKHVQKAKDKKEDIDTSDIVKVLKSQVPVAKLRYEDIIIFSAKETKRRKDALFKKHGIQTWKNFMLPLFQVPLWVTMSMTIRNLTGWLSWDNLRNKALDPSLHNEGFLWINDLTEADPMHIAPIVVGIASLLNIEWNTRTLELSMLSKRDNLRPTLTSALANTSKIMVIFLMGISMYAPSALSLYWITSQIYSLVQNVLLDLIYPIKYSPKSRIKSKPNDNNDASDIVNRS